jgi:hypothetical protein
VDRDTLFDNPARLSRRRRRHDVDIVAAPDEPTRKTLGETGGTVDVRRVGFSADEDP